jgi:hypothetical protein
VQLTIRPNILLIKLIMPVAFFCRGIFPAVAVRLVDELMAAGMHQRADILVNQRQPRSNSFIVEAGLLYSEGDSTFELLDLLPPFHELRDLDIRALAAQVIDRVNDLSRTLTSK